ncbi:MAG: nucleotidyltransferase domain-containing protein [Actinobacteria bacterium]|nr:nucleotidyltransferase domain-containing protein [Actinomycetota bacterium]
MKILRKEKINEVLNTNELDAIYELKNKLLKSFPGVELILFGSKVRGDFEEFSDIDILILVDKNVDHRLKDNIIEIAYDIELKYDIVFGFIIENKKLWRSPRYKVMPLYQNVEREGILI